MEILDGYKKRSMNGSGGFFGGLKKLWTTLGELEVVGYQDGQGIIVRNRRTGEAYGRHGLIEVKRA